MAKHRVTLWYRDTWPEHIEVEIPDGATWEQAVALRERAAEYHRPAGPPRARLSPANLEAQEFTDDPDFPLAARS